MLIGQVIKKLRKERNLTQEELAELLNVTSQAISKWENGAGLPDISQIVPIASVFGVSTDVLFGTFGTSEDEEVRKILDNSRSLNNDKEVDAKRGWAVLQDGLKKYPNHLWLLVNCLERGNSLCYISGYDETHREEIFPECIRMANIIIAYSKHVTDVLRAHMIMVTLYAAYGNIEKAWEHALKFPWRADFTIHVMSAYIAHFENNYDEEVKNLQGAVMFHCIALFDDLVLLGEAHRKMKKYDAALRMFKRIFEIINIVYSHRPIPPSPLHRKDGGDVHILIARTYLEMGEIENALEWIEKMVDYDINISPQLNAGSNDENLSVQAEKIRLLKKLNSENFAVLRDDARFTALLERANDMV